MTLLWDKLETIWPIILFSLPLIGIVVILYTTLQLLLLIHHLMSLPCIPLVCWLSFSHVVVAFSLMWQIVQCLKRILKLLNNYRSWIWLRIELNCVTIIFFGFRYPTNQTILNRYCLCQQSKAPTIYIVIFILTWILIALFWIHL